MGRPGAGLTGFAGSGRSASTATPNSRQGAGTWAGPKLMARSASPAVSWRAVVRRCRLEAKHVYGWGPAPTRHAGPSFGAAEGTGQPCRARAPAGS